jgi:hypothetical protein
MFFSASSLLSLRAENLSKSDGLIYISEYDAGDQESPTEKLKINMTRPLRFLFTELIVFLWGASIAQAPLPCACEFLT